MDPDKLVSTLKNDGCGRQTGNMKKMNRHYDDMLDNRTGRKRLMQHDIVISIIIVLYTNMQVQNIFYSLNGLVCQCIPFSFFFFLHSQRYKTYSQHVMSSNCTSNHP